LAIRRLDHLQHRHWKDLVWKLSIGLPTVPAIEPDGRRVGFDNAKPACSTAAANYFGLALS